MNPPPAGSHNLIATLVGGVTVLVAGVVLIAVGERQTGVALAAAGATELGVKGLTLAG